MQCRHGIGKGLPLTNRLREAGNLFISHFKVELRGKVPDHSGQHFAIGFVDLLIAGLKLGIEIEYLAIGHLLILLLQQRAQIAENAGLPIDQRSVAIEGNVFELRKILHG